MLKDTCIVTNLTAIGQDMIDDTDTAHLQGKSGCNSLRNSKAGSEQRLCEEPLCNLRIAAIG